MEPLHSAFRAAPLLASKLKDFARPSRDAVIGVVLPSAQLRKLRRALYSDKRAITAVRSEVSSRKYAQANASLADFVAVRPSEKCRLGRISDAS
jgi:hypothetical protein